MTSKNELDALISKAGVSKSVAKKLHDANNTSTDSTTPAKATRSSGGHGPSTSQMPHFGDL